MDLCTGRSDDPVHGQRIDQLQQGTRNVYQSLMAAVLLGSPVRLFGSE